MAADETAEKTQPQHGDIVSFKWIQQLGGRKSKYDYNGEWGPGMCGLIARFLGISNKGP